MQFTVLISLYKNDDPVLFDGALASIFNNSLSPFRVLLMVDGPIDITLNNVIKKYLELYENIHVIRLEKNFGLARALNIGLSLVETEWIIRADSDDLNFSDRFVTLSNFMNADYDMVGSYIQEIDSKNNVLAIKRVPLTLDEILKTLPLRNPFNHMSVAYRVNFVKQFGGYPEIYLKEDYALWATLLSNGARAINVPHVLVSATTGKDFYRRRGGLKYAIAEINLQKHLVKTGIQNFFLAALIGIARSAIFLLPNGLREFIYIKYLRK